MSVRPRVPAVARERMAVGTFAKDCTRMISPKPAQGGLDSGAVVGDEHALPFRRRAAVLRPHALVRFCGGRTSGRAALSRNRLPAGPKMPLVRGEAHAHCQSMKLPLI